MAKPDRTQWQQNTFSNLGEIIAMHVMKNSTNSRRVDLIPTHHERVNNEIIVLEGIECLGSDDAILVALTQL